MLVRAGPRGRLPVPAPVASRFPRAWLLWGMCCRAHFCGRRGWGWGGGGGSPFGCVCANLQRKHVAHVIRDTARPRMRTCGRRRGACTQTYDNSCQLLSDPQPSPLGRGHSASSVTPPPTTLAHSHMRGSSFAWLHLCRGQVYSEPRRKHPRRESIHLTTEAFNTFKNSISKIATCLGETDRAGRRGAVKEGGWWGGGLLL